LIRVFIFFFDMSENLYSHTARFFVKNRHLSLLLTLASFAFGILAFIATPKQYNPEITLPAFRIISVFPGATADEVEKLVTNEIENKIAEIPGVDKLNSQSFAGGQSVVSVVFKIGSELEESKTKVIEKVESNLDLLPNGVEKPLIQQINPENVPIMSLVITSKKFSADGLRSFAFDLKEKLKTVQGVANIQILGGRSRQLSVYLDPDKLSARQIDINGILQIIAANNLRVRVGSMESIQQNTPLEIDGNIADAKTLGRLTVGGSPDQPVYLEDVARIDDGYGVIENYVSFTDKHDSDYQSVYLSFAKTKGANISDVTAEVEKNLEILKESFIPDAINIQITRDEGETAREEILMLTEHLGLAILIVTITLIFFLGLRAALVVATAIPLTLALVFIVGFFFHQTINRITLFALIFSLGLLVDDAIVVVENIYRHFSLKTHSKSEAIAIATGEVGMGVLLSTITAVIVFVPMGLVTGMMGAYMGPIAFFAPVARLASLFVAYTLSPYISSIFLKEDGHNTHGDSDKTAWYDAFYQKFIRKILDSRKLQNLILMVVIAFTAITFSFPIIELVHFRMLPKADKSQFYVYLDMPEGTSIESMNALTNKAQDELLKDSNIDSVESFVGTPPVIDFNGLFRGSDMRKFPYQSTLKVNLVDPKSRNIKSEDIVSSIRQKLLKAMSTDPDLRMKLVEDPPGPPVLSTLLARVKGPDPMKRDAIAKDLYAMFRETPGVVDLDSSLPTSASEQLLRIDHEKLAQSGLSVAQVVQALYTGVSGQPISMSHLETREQTNILVRFDSKDRKDINDISRIQLKNQMNQMVALSSIVHIETTTTPSAIWHDAREPMTLVGGEMQGRAVVYAVKDLIFRLLDYRLPNDSGELMSWNLFGFTWRDKQTHEEYKIEWGGEFEMTLENFRDLGIAMMVSYFLIYVILVAQFQSFRSPALIMTTILLGFAGVMPGFAILDAFAGVYFSATSMIGVIALGGLVVGNAILLLDFIEQLKSRGLPIKEAIIGACQTRLRPILLTSITAILGSIVIVSDPVWSGLAWAITFGLSLSTLLTLIIFPVLYYRFGNEKSSDKQAI
jgi:multidrug efflux pump subunit AcrB